MDIGKITQLAKDEFGPHVRCVYHQDFTGPVGQNHSKQDDIGAGEMTPADSNVAGSNPLYRHGPGGLFLSVERPSATGSMGSWAAATVENLTLPPAFLLVAVLKRPERMPLTDYMAGLYAAALLINNAGVLMGATCQFRPEGPRLNLPRTGAGPGAGGASIDPALQAQLVDSDSPADLTLALKADRTKTPVAGKAWLFVGNTLADALSFNFAALNEPSNIIDVRGGIGTADGVHYRASVYLLRFQMWA